MRTKTIIFLLICQVASSVKHSLKYFITASSGFPDFPEFVAAAMVDEVQVGYCDSNIKTAEPKQDWAKTFIQDHPQHLEYYTQRCFGNQQMFRAHIYMLKERFNQTGGVHILQQMDGCEWDDETDEITGFNQYGYDGEDFLALDLKTLTWTATRPQAVVTKLRWDAERARIESNKIYYIDECPELLKMYVAYWKKFLQRTEFPSVSLLQKSPSSPVTCHATGFYPHRAVMFWRRDGEEVHENVEHEEILPNDDGTFQMSVNVDLSSVKPEHWGRYDCVFQLSGVQDNYVIQLNKEVIRTNRAPPSQFPDSYIIGLVVGLLLLLVAIAGTLIWKRNNGFHLVQKGEQSTLEVDGGETLQCQE